MGPPLGLFIYLTLDEGVVARGGKHKPAGPGGSTAPLTLSVGSAHLASALVAEMHSCPDD